MPEAAPAPRAARVSLGNVFPLFIGFAKGGLALTQDSSVHIPRNPPVCFIPTQTGWCGRGVVISTSLCC